MANYLISSATVLSPGSKHHGKKRDVWISNGQIRGIGASLKVPKAKVIREPDLYISAGWIDLRAHFREPGEEFKEGLAQGALAAHKGGFAKVVLMPTTLPPIDHASAVRALLAQNTELPVEIIPTGCLSIQSLGKQLAEVYDMHRAGAVAFTDDKHPVPTELMLRALEYTRNFNGLVMTFPNDPSVAPSGQMHEGTVSVSLGLKGIPALSEELRLSRDLDLLRYTGGKMHVSLISAAGSVERIRKARKDGLQVTCAVAAHQLLYTHEELQGFESIYKCLPPLRTSQDKKALIAGIKDGTIDAICSDHSPEDIERKDREFEYASFGLSSIQSTFHHALKALRKDLSIEQIVEKFTTGPAHILGLDVPEIEEGSKGPFTVFSTSGETTFDSTNWASRSAFGPAMGQRLPGRIFTLRD
jgi:dihydroorotase